MDADKITVYLKLFQIVKIQFVHRVNKQTPSWTMTWSSQSCQCHLLYETETVHDRLDTTRRTAAVYSKHNKRQAGGHY